MKNINIRKDAIALYLKGCLSALLLSVLLIAGCKKADEQLEQTEVTVSSAKNLAKVSADPTIGWTQTSYTYGIQTPWNLPQSDRYSFSNGEHRFWIYPNDACQYQGCGTGPRSELRMNNNYTSGKHQFEGDVYITSGSVGTDIMQVFGGATHSTAIMLKIHSANGGTIKRYDNETLMTSAYNKWIHVNVQHDADGGRIYVYLDGVLKGDFADRGNATHYFKCGVYNISGTKSETRWKNVKYWKNGPVGGSGGGGSFSGHYRLMARHSGKALTVEGASTSNSANVFQYTYGGSATNDEWQISSIGSGYYRIINRNSGKDLTVASASTSDGANIFQYTYGGSTTNDEWQIVDLGSGYYRINNRHSGKAVEVAGSSTSNSANVNQRTWNGGTNQQFQIVSVP